MRSTSFLAAAMMLIAAPVVAGNLLVNPGFNANIDSWQISGPAAQAKIGYHDGDALLSVGSGSLMVSNLKPVVDGGVVGATQCVQITRGRYDLGADVYIPNY